MALILGIAVGSSSFLSGLISMCVFFKKNNTFSNRKETFNKGRIAAPISARLPSLISIEIILLLWYLMCCTPLILFFLLYPHMDTRHHLIGSIIFVFSFIPLYTIHIIRIWMLKLKYNVTSLSMLNQLGVAPWKDLRNTIWTKIYYNHKWCHNTKVLITLSILFDVLITALYSVLIWFDIRYRFYLNMTIFPLLTLCVIIGIFSIKSLRDPFYIFREEVSILFIWFLAAVLYALLTLILPQFPEVEEHLWTIVVTFLAAVASLISIITHFHFNDKSLKIIRKNAPSLGIVVSTKEGLEKFLKFLVSEHVQHGQLSVENLEFFTLSMRWRHRLVLRDQRRERRRQKRNNSMDHIDESREQIDKPKDLDTVSPKKPGNIAEMIDSLSPSSPFSSASPRPIPSNMALMQLQKQNLNATSDAAQTQLRALPFPLLTFEFLDRDVAKKKAYRNTITETSYCPEFSKTKTIAIPPKTAVSRQHRTQSIATKTMVSMYFDQYDAMEHNRSGCDTVTDLTLPTGTSSGAMFKQGSKPKSKSLRLRPRTTPTHGPVAEDTDDDDENSKNEADTMDRDFIRELSYDLAGTVMKNKVSAEVTPFVGPVERKKDRLNSSIDEPADFELGQLAATGYFTEELQEEIEFEDSDSEERRRVQSLPKVTLSVTDAAIKRWDTEMDMDHVSIQHTTNIDNTTDNLRVHKTTLGTQTKQRNEVTFGGWFDDNSFEVYDDEWTQEFMQKKRVDYDRFITLSEDINVSYEARVLLREFFKLYKTVKVFKSVEIEQYDVAFEMAWRDVWQNLNDSLRRFHQSKFYKEWLQSDAADGLNVLVTTVNANK
eukprot:870030_1